MCLAIAVFSKRSDGGEGPTATALNDINTKLYVDLLIIKLILHVLGSSQDKCS